MENTKGFCSLDDTTDLRDELSEIRHRLHQNPELAFKEFQTSDLVAQNLESWGYKVTRGLGGTGMVASLTAWTGARAVVVRSYMDASDTVNITIHGRGGHAARPHLAVDPVVIGAALVTALQTVVARSIDPMQTAVVTVGAFNAGHAANVIPESARLQISVRSFDPGVRKLLEARIRALTDAQASAYGASVESEYVPGYPVAITSQPETELAVQVAREPE